MSSQSFALIEGQLLIGQRSASTGDGAGGTIDYSGMENKISVYLDPIPLIPVGFGLTMASIAFDDTDAVKDIKGTETSLDLTAWLPLGIAGFKPYAKIAYIVSGEYSFTDIASGISSDSKTSGTKFAAGVKYSPLPLVGFMLEVEKSSVEIEPDTGTSSTLDGLGVLLGASVGI